MRPRSAWVDKVAEALGGRRLRWIGPRGADARAIFDIPQLSGSVSLTAPWECGSSISAEHIVGRRVDVDAYDPDNPSNRGVESALWDTLGDDLNTPNALLPYRGYPAVGALTYSRRTTTMLLGMFPLLQDVFEHKPFVESELRALGVEVLPWRYVRRTDRRKLERDLSIGPVVLRYDRTSGGNGFIVARDLEEIDRAWPETGPSQLAATTLLNDTVAINAGGVVWPTTTTVHPASVQLIGVPGLTARRFGFTGSDFCAVGSIEPPLLEGLEVLVIRVGDWLRSHGYRGAFGVDALWYEGRLHFMELNARFQGSSVGSAMLSAALDLPCLYLEHIGVFLGFDPPPTQHLSDLWASSPALSTFTVHNVGAEPVTVDACELVSRFGREPDNLHIDLIPSADLPVDSGGALARVFVPSCVTSTGANLNPAWRSRLHEWNDVTLKVAV